MISAAIGAPKTPLFAVCTMTELRALDERWQELEQAPRGPSAAQLSQYLKQVAHSVTLRMSTASQWWTLL